MGEILGRVRLVAAIMTTVLTSWSALPACCPAPPPGTYAVNADQTVVILWDATKRTQHFIRQASFKSDAADFGFIIPSPSVPELAESGNDAFELLRQFTKAEVEYRRKAEYLNCGCSASKSAMSVAAGAQVLLEKRVAGFDAVVLAADKTDDLTTWLKDHDYAYSPAVAAWAEPYVKKGWKFTALKVAKHETDAKQKKVDAAALRMSFATDEPLFPYREPDYGTTVDSSARRTLRIYFLAEARYAGNLTPTDAWSGRTVWSDVLSDGQSTALLKSLQLPAEQLTTGPAATKWRLTEFEDSWAYRIAPADVTFVAAQDQAIVHRPKIIVETADASWLPSDATVYAMIALILWPRLRRGRRQAA